MITVLRAPPFSTVQDLGRRGYLDAAVPPAGALDPVALEAANLLVGNERGAAGLEWGLGGGELRFDRAMAIALTGAPMQGTLGGRSVSMWQRLRADVGDALLVERLDGAWLYLAVTGGIDVPLVLGSRSTYLPARLGGMDGRVLRTGDRLPIGGAPAGPRTVEERLSAVWQREGDAIAILRGPEAHLLDDGQWRRLLDTEFRISRASNRMGYRLEGAALAIAALGDRPSAPACVGTVQITVGGTPIVLLADGPTVGGYPRVAVVATADLGQFAQRRPGDQVRFRLVELGEAREALRRQRATLDKTAV